MLYLVTFININIHIAIFQQYRIEYRYRIEIENVMSKHHSG